MPCDIGRIEPMWMSVHLGRAPHTRDGGKSTCVLCLPRQRSRLPWQESRFNPSSVSHAGAQGIAQFMPGTARLVGLANPFDPIQALPKSAALLRDLRAQFGNLGLAAAAYNAGPKRIEDWLVKRK